MEFVIGFLGALVLNLIIIGSGFLGWKLRGDFEQKQVRSTAEELTDRERQEIKDAVEAQHLLHNYNADMAYGLHLDKRSDSI